MSGPKDFTFYLAEWRAAQIRARIAADRAARQSTTLATLELARRSTADRLARLKKSRSEKLRDVLERDRLANAAVRARTVAPSQTARPATDEIPSGAGAVPQAVRRGEEDTRTLPGDKLLTTTDDDSLRANSAETELEHLMQWQATLAQDQAVEDFCVGARKIWADRAEALLLEHTEGVAATSVSERAAMLVSEARSLHEEAGDIQAKHSTRNELLRDVMDAFSGLGFYVTDPTFEDPGNPAGAVIVKATLGSEEVVASVDLTNAVHSVWNGMDEQHCKDAFFAYVDQMKSRGVTVSTERSDLQRRPILKQKGAKDLPRQGDREAGRL